MIKSITARLFLMRTSDPDSLRCSFYPSSITHKYIPRLTFKKVDLSNNDKSINQTKPINISLQTPSNQSYSGNLLAF